jgi:hypothetical protein
VADQVPRDVVAGLFDLGDDVAFAVVVARLLWRALPPFHVAEALELRQQLEAEPSKSVASKSSRPTPFAPPA